MKRNSKPAQFQAGDLRKAGSNNCLYHNHKKTYFQRLKSFLISFDQTIEERFLKWSLFRFCERKTLSDSRQPSELVDCALRIIDSMRNSNDG